MEPFTRGLGTEGSIYLFFFLHCNSRSHGFPLFPAKISYFHVPRAYTCFILSLVPNLETRLGLHRPGWHARRQRVIRCSTDYTLQCSAVASASLRHTDLVQTKQQRVELTLTFPPLKIHVSILASWLPGEPLCTRLRYRVRELPAQDAATRQALCGAFKL